MEDRSNVRNYAKQDEQNCYQLVLLLLVAAAVDFFSFVLLLLLLLFVLFLFLLFFYFILLFCCRCVFTPVPADVTITRGATVEAKRRRHKFSLRRL